MCFLTFNASAMLGSLVSNWIRWVSIFQLIMKRMLQVTVFLILKEFSVSQPSPKYLVIPVVLRALFIPFFLFCNFQPTDSTRALPVLIHNDWAYWCAGILLGFTSGYFSSISMMYTSRWVSIKKKKT